MGRPHIGTPFENLRAAISGGATRIVDNTRRNLSTSSTLGTLLDPVGSGYDKWKAGASLTGGDVTDPGGFFHNLGTADNSVVAAPSPNNIDNSSLAARDRVRRAAKRAQGLDSTIRTSPAGAPYTGQPKSLLGS